MADSGVVEVVLRLARALEEAGIEYAVGGAIALAFWATPRATVDVDIAVDVDALRLPYLLQTLKAAGCALDDARARQSAQRGDFGTRLEGIRIDVFLPVLPLAVDALARRVRVPLGDGEIWILSAEDVALYKVLFGRTKDFADLERLLATRGSALDAEYLGRWLADMFEPTDERKTRFEALARRAGIPLT